MLNPATLQEIKENEELRARFCLVTNKSTDEFDSMTPGQVQLWVKMWEKINKKR